VNNHITNDSRARYPLFGLPVDNLDMAETKALLRQIAKGEKQVVLSTINVNWVIAATRDPDFKAAILKSDIVVLDGKPLLWLSTLRGYPMREVVPGSTLIQGLHQDKTTAPPLTIFLFGGKTMLPERPCSGSTAIEAGSRPLAP
jgi:N-acetylglucosaminyldiphosphoundecaprenol N-acetyl-beta-D-mannosaminyltransferase